MLASGEIADLFSDEEIDNIISLMKNEVKQLGFLDTRESCWKYFIDKVKRMLKVSVVACTRNQVSIGNFPFRFKIVLCFSPVGATLRRRSRKFPALVNCTAINYFHEWPKTALESVSKKFLAKLDVLPVSVRCTCHVRAAFPPSQRGTRSFAQNK